jgi:hypothetical protein
MKEDRTAADEIEFEIKRLLRGGFKATVHISRGRGGRQTSSYVCRSLRR